MPSKVDCIHDCCCPDACENALKALGAATCVYAGCIAPAELGQLTDSNACACQAGEAQEGQGHHSV